LSGLLIKRVYASASSEDGFRILVDRLWPRGLSKSDIQIDAWARDIAPSTAIRKAFHHDPSRMDVFRANYIDELEHNPAAIDFINLVAEKLRAGTVTLLYAAKNEVHNHVVILRDWLLDHLSNIHA
jgi:uncharacterized protein YeaO (DUF488 family)